MEGGRYNVIYAEMISHHDDYHVSFTSATCCKDHIPPCKDKNWLDQYWNDMPPWTIMYHSTPLTCCIDQTRQKKERGRKREKRNLLFKKGGTPLHDFCESHYAHMVLTVMRQVQGPFDWNFICSKTAGICGINLRSTTVVCWQVHSPMGDPSSRVENKKRKRKKVLELNYLNQKFGTAFLQFRFWSGKNHLDGAGWFFVSDG